MIVHPYGDHLAFSKVNLQARYDLESEEDELDRGYTNIVRFEKEQGVVRVLDHGLIILVLSFANLISVPSIVLKVLHGVTHCRVIGLRGGSMSVHHELVPCGWDVGSSQI